jgi:hypothetical protein
MAINVYLSIFRRYNESQLRTLEWRYMTACYGISFIPAFVLLFIKSKARGKVYGSAVVRITVMQLEAPLYANM